MVSYHRAKYDYELKAILKLQKQNLPDAISNDTKHTEGFVTVNHSFELIKLLNDKCAHIIAKDEDDVVGYALCMHPDFKNDIPILKPMFIKIDSALSRPLNYIVMGQICIAYQYRRQGIFRGLYASMEQQLYEVYDAVITEVDNLNSRSLNAHYAVGFDSMCEYISDGHHWNLLIKKWK